MDNIHLELIDVVNYGLPDFITTVPLHSSGKENY